MARKAKKQPKKEIDTDLDFVIKTLQHSNIYQVSMESEVSDQTLYNWMSGRTTRPRWDTLNRVAKALGLRVVVTIQQLKKK
jgi:DNA-binding phage protein